MTRCTCCRENDQDRLRERIGFYFKILVLFLKLLFLFRDYRRLGRRLKSSAIVTVQSKYNREAGPTDECGYSKCNYR